jgi:hypothetical protein
MNKPKDKIEVVSRFQDSYHYIVKLQIGKKLYKYDFLSQEQWEQYYYHYSYKSHPTAYTRIIKFSLLNAIKQFLIN